MSRIFETLGAKVEDIPILWIAAPVTGLVVQPIVGYLSDRTWNRLGRRRPYFLSGAILASVDALAKDAAGNLFAAISTADAQGRMHAVIRKSSAHGTTWSVVEDYLHAGESSTRFLGLGVDAAGSVYAAGYAEDQNGHMRWVVRKSSVDGNSWSTVDDFVWPGGQKTMAQ